LNNAGSRDRIGALDYAIGSVEAQFPLGLPEALGISGEVFSDFGTAFNSNNPGQAGCVPLGACTFADEMGLRASIGAGVVWDSPFGQLKFEYAYPIVAQPTDDQKWFNFSIGTRF
jgi:outer membrane protein insertion porin family